MTKKQKLIIIAVTVITVGAFVINRLIPEVEKILPTPSPTPRGEREAEKIEVTGVEINNFYDEETDINTRGDAMFVNTDKYQIVFFSNEQQFLISILDSPFDEVRKQAEKEFLKELGISRGEACTMNVLITTPGYANPENAGRNYRLSFCN